MTKLTYVYVFAKVDSGGFVAPVKVGMTGSVGARIATIQTSTPFKIGLVHAFAFPDAEIARAVESFFHRALDGVRVHGEWFDMSPADAMAAMSATLATVHSEWPGMEAIQPPLNLAQFFYLTACPPDWVWEAVKRSVEHLADKSKGTTQ